MPFDRSRHLLPLLGVAAALAVTAAYANHFSNAFHFDDSHVVESNLYLRDLRNLPRFFTDASTFSTLPSNQSYRPVLTATLALDYAIGRLDPRPYHVTSFLCFLLTALLLFVLSRRVLLAAGAGAAAGWTALFAAAWFGLHTAHAETVNYVSARSDLLSTLAVVGALVLYGSPRARRLQLHLVVGGLGVLAKEQAAMLAPLLFLYEGLVERRHSVGELLRPRTFLQVLWKALPTFLVCFGALALTRWMAPGWTPGGASRLQYLWTQPFVIVHYLLSFVLPVGLSADSDWTLLPSPLDDRVQVGVLALAGLVAVAWRCSRTPEGRPIALGLLWFLLALLPTSSVIPLAEVLNDHRPFFANAGLVLAAGQALALLARRVLGPGTRRLAVGAGLGAALLLGAHGWGVHLRNEVWRTEESLWRDVTLKSPGNGRGWMNYGLSRLRAGAIAEARDLFEKAVALSPRYGYAHANLAVALGALGNATEADAHFQQSVALQPDVPALQLTYARWLGEVGRHAEAITRLRRALALSPAEVEARRLLLVELADTLDWAGLRDAARATLAIQPGEPRATELLALAEDGLRGAPGLPPPDGGQTLTAALVAQGQRAVAEGRYPDALALTGRALALRDRLAEALEARGAALLGLGRFDEAAAACERALALRPGLQGARVTLAAARQALGR
jgi:tetratricopeptide (TPR) repeat protein